jgi:hypothetical protein
VCMVARALTRFCGSMGLGESNGWVERIGK